MPRRCRSDYPPDGRLPPGRRFLPPQLLLSEVLRRLREQSLLVQQLIAAFGLDFRVAYTPADHHAVTIVLALRDIDFQVLILGIFRLVDVPPP
jgi:hypothetical protein